MALHIPIYYRDVRTCVSFVVILLVLAMVSCKKNNSPIENISVTANGIEFKMIYVEGGIFVMGTNDTVDTYPRERPAHQVTVPSFYIAETEVTQALWTAVMGNNPSFNNSNNQLPVEQVTWGECQQFIARLNDITGQNFALPTEAEWEWAAIGGNKGNGFLFAGSNNPPEIGWVMDNSNGTTHPVKSKKPNELGLYDMTGNVWEWCQDWYSSHYYEVSPEYNPQGLSTDSELFADTIPCHPLRGGGFGTVVNRCRNTHRVGINPTISALNYGLRLVLRQESTNSGRKKASP